MKLIEILRKIGNKNSSQWNDDEKQKITEAIDGRNKEFKVIREVIFPGQGQPYCYYYDNDNVRAEGFYYALGYDKNGLIRDEKFQGRNIEYFENGVIKELCFYEDGVPTGEYYSYDEEGKLIFSSPIS